MAQNIRQVDGLLRTVPAPGEKVLPKVGENNILITSALPYCNNVPHLGNIIGSTLSADVLSRYSRTRNRRTLYICGTDEYGTATETQALKENISPQELCDKYHQLHRETYDWFEIGFDHFGRTSTEKHTEISQDIYLHLSQNNCLEKQVKNQTYCEGCQRFLADRLVEGKCPNCGFDDARGDQCDGCSRTLDPLDLIQPRCQLNKSHTIVSRPSAHMYIKLNEIQTRLEAWIKQSWSTGKWSPNVIINADGEIIDARLRGGLRPSPVTRDLRWGIPVPLTGNAVDDEEMKSKVLYVWFDAPIGYISITANYTPEWRQWWLNPKNVKLYQFMGKDNAYFHCVLFPSMLLGDSRDWTKLHHISTTEFLNYEGGKFSKSRNRGVFGPAAKETGISSSTWRYYLLSTRPETSDSMFSWNEFVMVNNGVLLNNFGNFVNRAIKFVAAKYNSVVPDCGDAPGPLSTEDDQDGAFITEVNNLLCTYVDAMEAVKLRLGLQTVMLISARGNLYLQQSGLGNALLSENPKRCAQVVARVLNLIYVLSVVVYPFMPSTSESILCQLNAPPRIVPDVLSNDILPGHKIGTPAYLFRKIEEKQAEVWKAKFGGSVAPEQVAVAVAANKGPPEMSKRKAAAANKTAAKAVKIREDLEKSEVVLGLEAKVKAQGDVVRGLKEKKKKNELLSEEELSKALSDLLSLKTLLTKELAKN